MIPDLKQRALAPQQNDNEVGEMPTLTPITDEVRISTQEIKSEVIEIEDNSSDNWGDSVCGTKKMMYSTSEFVYQRQMPRRPKRLVPDHEKDDNYWVKRKKNNDAARKSREMKRKLEVDIRQRLLIVENDNALLRKELAVLKEKFCLEKDKRYTGVTESGELQCENITHSSLNLPPIEEAELEDDGYSDQDVRMSDVRGRMHFEEMQRNEASFPSGNYSTQMSYEAQQEDINSQASTGTKAPPEQSDKHSMLGSPNRASSTSLDSGYGPDQSYKSSSSSPELSSGSENSLAFKPVSNPDHSSYPHMQRPPLIQHTHARQSIAHHNPFSGAPFQGVPPTAAFVQTSQPIFIHSPSMASHRQYINGIAPVNYVRSNGIEQANQGPPMGYTGLPPQNMGTISNAGIPVQCMTAVSNRVPVVPAPLHKADTEKERLNILARERVMAYLSSQNATNMKVNRSEPQQPRQSSQHAKVVEQNKQNELKDENSDLRVKLMQLSDEVEKMKSQLLRSS